MSMSLKKTTANVKLGTVLELLWPPSGQWQIGTVTHDWGNGEFAISFKDDPFDEPLSYRLDSYEFRVLSQQNTVVKSESSSQQPMSCDESNKESAEEVDEIFAIIDNVCDPSGQFNKFRISWRGLSLTDCTWEPKEHLLEASEMMLLYSQMLLECNSQISSNSEIRKVRLSPFDNNLLTDLWNVLNQENDDLFGIVWQSEGAAFQVISVSKFEFNFLKRNEHNLIAKGNYAQFSDRMTVLGFEQEEQAKLYHHPCFQSSDASLIELIAQNSITVPSKQEIKSALFKLRAQNESKDIIVEQQKPIVTPKAIVALPINNNKQNVREINKESPRNNKNEKENEKNKKMISFEFDLHVPSEIGLDLNQCHLWTEHEVAEWFRYVPNGWGTYYAKKLIENGVDGRVLLEFDLQTVIKQCQIQTMHQTGFIQGVNQLRNVKKSQIKQQF